MTIWTIGHSTRTLEELVCLLQAHCVRTVVDVRTVPRSRHNPQFNKETLPEQLQRHGIAYQHRPDLGGLRKPAPDSKNLGWKNAGFRGYADYMQTPGFESGIEKLLALAAAAQVSVMCAEALPWRCHRSLIADALTARGVEVLHIGPGTAPRSHRMTQFARVAEQRVTYPGLPGL